MENLKIGYTVMPDVVLTESEWKTHNRVSFTPVNLNSKPNTLEHPFDVKKFKVRLPNILQKLLN